MNFLVVRNIQRPHLFLKHHICWDFLTDLSDRNWLDASNPNALQGFNLNKVALEEERQGYEIVRDAYFGACRTYDNAVYWVNSSPQYSTHQKNALDRLANQGFHDFPSVGQQRNYWKDVGNAIEVVRYTIDPVGATIKEIGTLALKEFGPQKITPVKRKWK